MSCSGVEGLSWDAPAIGGPVMMNQRWRDLTFLHWAIDPQEVAHRMPPGVRPDTLNGVTYVGLIPFRMVGAGIARGPAVPWVGSFLETNVRLYSVDETGRRGIVFLSLDADRAAVVVGARAAFGLPYRWARMRYLASDNVHSYDARLRRLGSRTESHILIRAGARRENTELDDFVSARWGLHVRWWGRTLYVPNHHEPWPVHDAEVLELQDGLLASVGLPHLASRPPDHVAFSPGVRTQFGLLGRDSPPALVTEDRGGRRGNSHIRKDGASRSSTSPETDSPARCSRRCDCAVHTVLGEFRKRLAPAWYQTLSVSTDLR